MLAMLAIVRKDLTLLLRDRGNAFFTFGFPLLIAIFFGTIFGGSGDRAKLPIVVVDESRGKVSAAFLEDLAADSLIAVEQGETREAGENRVRRGSALACVVIPADFEAKADRLLSGGSLDLVAVVDPARKAEGALLAGKLNEVAFRQLARIFTDPERLAASLAEARTLVRDATGLSPVDRLRFEALFAALESLGQRFAAATPPGDSPAPPPSGMQAWSPIRIDLQTVAAGGKQPANAYAVTFPQGIAWGMMSCVLAFASSLADERRRGTLRRLAVAPIRRWQILLGKSLACVVTGMAIVTLLAVVASLGFSVRIGSFAALAVAGLASSACFAGIMMLLAGIFRTEGGAQGAGRAAILVLAMIGGGSIPIIFMPRFMQVISVFSPFSWSIYAVEGAIWRGFGPAEMAWPCAVLGAIGVACFAVGATLFRRVEV
jgi:ABC-2 type transport system permease protein